ncbi:sulfotransferase [Microvirga sp. 2MCAF35]|uniref:sulfotransferase family protein n=1 Tax=Microvirga sp. 2MCAF35 TaxID=3232987 RepID=UPI003F94E531
MIPGAHQLRSSRYHFISGLPRSGSTLLSGILLQNPRFHAGMTSPVGSLCSAVLGQVSAGSEFAPVVGTVKRRELLRGLFDSYYSDVERDVIFDTNRSWCARLPLIHDLFPQAKVIACVRNVAWIMDSFERLYRANPYEHTRLFGVAGARGTVYSRLEGLAQHDQTVGYAWSALREAFYGEHASSLLVVDYELLTRAPAKVMTLIYDFLGEPHFEHDFDNVEYDAEEFDQQLGAPSLHKVKAKVKFTPRPTIIPPDLFDKFNQMSFWNDKAGSAANVIAAQPSQQGNQS